MIMDCNYSCGEKANHSYAPTCNHRYMAKTLGEQIKAIREAAGHSHEAAGKLVGISRQAFKKWETGDTENIKLGNLLRFCDKYHINIESLLRGTISASPAIEHYEKTPNITLVVANEPNPDEREVIEGYRAASPEVKEMFLALARQALQKIVFIKRNDHQ